MNIQQELPTEKPMTAAQELHHEWLTALYALAPFTREDALDVVMERMADAIDTYLLAPIEAVDANDKEKLLKAQGQAELLKQQQTTMHIFELCEKE